jgi:hypothetical protein
MLVSVLWALKKMVNDVIAADNNTLATMANRIVAIVACGQLVVVVMVLVYHLSPTHP